MAIEIDYQALEENRVTGLQDELQTQLEQQVSVSAGGRIDSLRNTILGLVVSGEYETAASEMNRYVELKKDYPVFKTRTERYFDHCNDLIHAIKTKRNFPGMTALSRSKQQELFEKVLQHFNELKEFLKKIEYIDREIRLDDMKSTVWTIKSFAYTSVAVFAVGLFLELTSGTANSFNIVFDDMVQRLLTAVFGAG